MNNLGEALSNTSTAVLERMLAYLPSLLGALALLLAGWVLARIMRALVMRSVLLADNMLGRFISAERGTRAQRAASVFGTVVFWTVLLVFVTAATQVLELTSFTDWLARLVAYLPTLAAGILIVVAGHLVSRFFADLVMATASRVDAPQRALLARITQLTIFVGAILVGADQIGIKITFLAIFVGALAAVVGGGVALAVGLGSRDHVANLIGSHQMRQAFAVGQTIRVAGHQGQILEITTTSIVLECEEGRINLPGRLYGEEAITVIRKQPNG